MRPPSGYHIDRPELSKKRTRRPSESPSCPLPSPSPDGSMERQPPEYQQSGLPSPYPSHGDNQSESSSADQTPVTPYAGHQQEVRPTAYSASATPTSEYSVYPTSSRSGSFPEHIQRSYHPANHTAGGSGGMAQTPSPSAPLPGGPRGHQSPQQVKSDSDVPIDPSIAAPSPTYGHGHYPPYAAPPQDMAHGYHTGGHGLYPQARPDWSGYQQSPAGPLTPTHHVFPQTPNSAHPNRPAQVYSFVPLPGAQQHKRPRRRYEEIERMYKCGYNGCQKAYGTLNHLNAHVTMQSHGAKRTPDEFKEIRREWKARKKEEEARKAAEDRQRQATAAHNGVADPQTAADGAQPATTYASARSVQLPPLGYQATQYPAQQQPQPMGEFHNNHMYHTNYSPSSPYPPSNQYNQHNGNQQGTAHNH